MTRRLTLILFAAVVSHATAAQDVTLATFNCEFLVRQKVHIKFGESFNLSGAAATTWNQPGFRDARFGEAAAAVADVLASLNTDVLLLTEVGNATDVEELHDSLAARGAPYPFRFVGRSRDSSTGQHVAVLSRLPLSGFHEEIRGREGYLPELDDPETEDDTGLSKALRVTVDAHGRPLIVYLAHLIAERGGPEADAQRVAQASLLRRHMLPALLADSLVIAAGDFNDRRGQPALLRLRGFDDLFPDLIQTGLSRYFSDDEVGERWTYTFDGVRGQIDHVLVSYGVKDACRSQRGIETRIVEHNNALASDHRPLVVTLHLQSN
ncbi:MAG: hypothetical protein HKN04_05990 [Rhodothermaceae bacterium]|nr:hypothetical protein [Rhodothermaceae bacterium]